MIDLFDWGLREWGYTSIVTGTIIIVLTFVYQRIKSLAKRS